MKLEYLHQLGILILFVKKKLSWIKNRILYGKLHFLDFEFLSIIMEYADNGDLFQKISA